MRFHKSSTDVRFLLHIDYESLDWFGYPVADKFGGYNQIPFPFWSSKAITESMLILALSKEKKVNDL